MAKDDHPDLRPFREKTLTEIEGEDWGPPTYDSYLVTTVHRLRHVPLKRFGIEDLRILIGQEIGLPWLVPIALNHLEKHPFAAGDYYPGDLLRNVATISQEFWSSRPELRDQLNRALNRALERIHKIDTVPELAPELRSAFQQLSLPK
jgi:hypothetical protein